MDRIHARGPVINTGDVEFSHMGHGDAFACDRARIGGIIGMEKLGCMVMRVAPGKRAFPFHVHHNNEEMFVILEGTGVYRFGDARHEIRAGDILAAPAGGPERAHQIINTGSGDLRYLSISTKNQPEIVEYPDSGKFLVGSQSQTGSPLDARFRYIGTMDGQMDYWDGETGEK